MILIGGKGDAAGSMQLMAIAVWRCWAPSGHFINVSVFPFPSPCPHHSFPPPPHPGLDIQCVLAKSLQSSLTLCDPMDRIPPPGSLTMGFSRQEYWNGLPRPSAGDLPDPGIKSASCTSPTLAVGFFTTSTTWEAPVIQWLS